MPTLIAESGPLAGQRIDVERELTVGRVDGDLVIEDAKLSRRHAVFRVVGDGLEAEDLGSTNGTFVGDQKIDGPARLRDGDQVRLGSSRFAVEIPVAQIDATQIDRTVIDRAALDDDRTEFHPRVSEPAAPAAEPPAEPALDATEIRPSAAAPPPPPPPPPAATPPPPPPAATAPPPPIPPPASPTPPPAASPTPVPAASAAPIPIPRSPAPGSAGIAAFSPPAVRKGGLATRSWVPVAASYGSAILAAIALIVYFVTR